MTEKNWFIFKGDHHLGPFTFNEILNKVKLAQLKEEELLWREGDSDWKPLREQDDIFGALQKEKELLNQDRKKIEDEIRESERRKYAARVRKQRESATSAIPTDDVRPKAGAEGEEDCGPPPLPFEKLESTDELVESVAQQEAPTESFFEEGGGDQSSGENYKEKHSFIQEVAAKDLANAESILEADSERPSYDESQLDSYSESEDGEDDSLLEDEDEDEDEDETKGRSFFGSIGLVVVVTILLFFSYDFLFKVTRSLEGLSKRDRDSFANLSSQPFTGSALHKLRPTVNLNSLWLVSNFPNEAAVYLKMESLKGQILGDERVVIQATSSFKGQAAHFKELEVIRGQGLIPGEYSYEIKGHQTGLMKNLKSFLRGLLLLKEFKALNSAGSEFSFKGTILVSSSSAAEFKAVLSKKKQAIEKTILRPLRDRRQRIKTFLDLLNKVEAIYNNTLSRITKGSSIHIFEDRYNKEVGPYLRDLIIDSNKVHLSLINLNKNESKAYEEIMNFGKDVGHISAQMVTETKKIRLLSKKRTQVVKERFRLEVDELRKKGEAKLQSMNGAINKYSSDSK